MVKRLFSQSTFSNIAATSCHDSAFLQLLDEGRCFAARHVRPPASAVLKKSSLIWCWRQFGPFLAVLLNESVCFLRRFRKCRRQAQIDQTFDLRLRRTSE